MRTGISITVSDEDRQRLKAVVDGRQSAQKHVWRCRIVLLTADGHGTQAIMTGARVSKTCVWRWQERFMAAGVDGLLRDRTRPLRGAASWPPELAGKAPVAAERVAEVVGLTLARPPHQATHWTARALMAKAMAKAVGLADTSVQDIWQAHGLSPHRWRQFKRSNDKAFAEKLRDVVGLHVTPPAHAPCVRAIVLSLDEKSQIPALDRTQPGLPLKKGCGATMTHDYKRHGTTTLFAARECP